MTNETYGGKRWITTIWPPQKKMQKGRERGPCYFDHLKCSGVSFQRKSDVPGVAYFVQREGSMQILCRGRRVSSLVKKKKLILKFSTNV